MQPHYFLSIDGGGTRCRARLTDRQNHLLAEAVGGPANVWSQFEAALASVEALTERVMTAAGLPPAARAQIAMVAGLAGANVASVKARLADWQPVCASLRVVGDVDIACLGAHQGAPGAALIVGTGSQGVLWDGERFSRVGGWGFALSDHGSGAELGRRTLRLALLAHEGIVPETAFTDRVMGRFDRSPEAMLLWTQRAMPADWGSVVPEVFAAAQAGDPHADQLIQQTADDIALLVRRLMGADGGRLALMGGLAEPVQPWLAPDILAMLVPPLGDALSGAGWLARQG
ncbi:BadF/BadG/BcrA/BcrD ATPase family protein [Erwinia sp. HDF1-3R]|uniref:BadF/BadG/BcrA/BcrD ATPase family protein n=1 Tax=Erwinia sp. HDF1-3R TaxID=3141543 RepID=UPI0031F5AD71